MKIIEAEKRVPAMSVREPSSAVQSDKINQHAK